MKIINLFILLCPWKWGMLHKAWVVISLIDRQRLALIALDKANLELAEVHWLPGVEGEKKEEVKPVEKKPFPDFEKIKEMLSGTKDSELYTALSFAEAMYHEYGLKFDLKSSGGGILEMNGHNFFCHNSHVNVHIDAPGCKKTTFYAFENGELKNKDKIIRYFGSSTDCRGPISKMSYQEFNDYRNKLKRT